MFVIYELKEAKEDKWPKPVGGRKKKRQVFSSFEWVSDFSTMGTLQGLRVSYVKMQISGFQLQLFLIQESQDKAPWICVFDKAPGELCLLTCCRALLGPSWPRCGLGRSLVVSVPVCRM